MQRVGDVPRRRGIAPGLLLLAALGVVAWLLLDPGTPAPEPPPEDPGPPATPARMDHALREAPASEVPELPPEGARQTPFVPEVRSPEPSALLARVREEPERYRALVEAARQYFDLDEEQWKGRRVLLDALAKHAKEGERFLAEPDALRWLVAQGRSFLPPWTDREWQRANGITQAKGFGGTLEYMKGEQLALTFSVPPGHPKQRQVEKGFPRVAPYPLLISMHEKRDFAERYPGRAVIERRYGAKKLWHSLSEEWLVLAPHAARGVFVSSAGQPRAQVFQWPFSQFWKHYHVDFDRVIVDGTEDAFVMAGSMPVFWAGIVFRGDWRLTDEQKLLVTNFANVPVYVVDNPKLADDLGDAGHPDVTRGPADEALVQWMTDRRRRWPKRFTWRAQRTDQVLAYWVNLDSLNWKARSRCVEVAVGEAPEEGNTIRIRTSGVNLLSLFLHDGIVDLDDPVHVYVNGRLVHAARLPPLSEELATVGRDFDFLFNREPLKIRESMYFGWLTPARIVQIPVRNPAPPRADGTAGPQATPEEQARAERLWNKVQDLLKNGRDQEAATVLERVRALRAARREAAAPPAPEEQPEREIPADPLPCPTAAAPHANTAPPDEAPLVKGPVERLEPPEPPPPHEPGEVELPQEEPAPPAFDGRWMLALVLAVLALLVWLRRR